VSDRTLRRAVAVLALAGAGIAAYLVYARFTGTAIACATGGCETVQRSRYSTLAGLPVAVLGLGAFLAIGASALVHEAWALAAAAAIAVAGVAFAGYLLVVQVLVIDAICQWCVASDTILALLALTAIERLRLCRSEVQRPRGLAAVPHGARSAKNERSAGGDGG
jgi:uncharacterized membrane protein